MRAYVFPGQGIQRKGMGKDLFGDFLDSTEQANEVLGYSIKDLCLKNPAGKLNNTQYSQPAVYVVNAFFYLKHKQLNQEEAPSYFAGHSLGEYNALFAAGAFDFVTGLTIVNKRAQLMNQSKGGTMAAILGLRAEAVNEVLENEKTSNVTIANYNTPTQVVISGSKREIEKLKSVFESIDAVKMFLEIRTSGAFHSLNMKTAKIEFTEYLKDFKFSKLVTPVISNVTAKPYRNSEIAKLLCRQIVSPVKWVDCIQYLKKKGVVDFDELGESTVLSGLIKQINSLDPMDELKKNSKPRSKSSDSKKTIKPSIRKSIAGTLRPSKSVASKRLLLPSILSVCKSLSNRPIQIFHLDDSIEEISGAALDEKASVLGRIFISLFDKQEKIVIMLPQNPQFTTSLLACWYANCVVIPTPITDVSQFQQKSSIIVSILKNSCARYIVTNAEFERETTRVVSELVDYKVEIINIDTLSESADRSLPARYIDGVDLALVLYTSGSTSQPKGVMINHETLFNTATSPLWSLSQDSRIVSWLPQFHAFGISFGLLAPLVRGALNVIYPPENFIKAPESWFQFMHRYRATHTGAPSFAFNYCCDSIASKDVDGLVLDSLQSLICGGDIIHVRSYDRFFRKFCDLGFRENVLTPNYGLSEAGPISVKAMDQPASSLVLDRKSLERHCVKGSGNRNGQHIFSSGEIDNEVTKVVFVDLDSGELCDSGKVGEVWLKSACQGQGYLNDQHKTQEVFNATPKGTGEGGFLRTGDLGFIANNQLYIVGREKDLIIVNGKNYYFSDIEASLKDDAESMALACAVLTTTTVVDAEILVVVQEIDLKSSEQDYKARVNKIISIVSENHQLELHEIIFVEKGTIPITGSKKIRRKECRTKYLNNDFSVLWQYNQTDASIETMAVSYSSTPALDLIKKEVFIPILGSKANSLEDDAPLSHMGLDSINYIRLARKIEEVFDVRFKPGMLFRYDNCLKLVEYLSNHGKLANDKAQCWLEYKDESLIELLRECSMDRRSIANTVEAIRENI